MLPILPWSAPIMGLYCSAVSQIAGELDKKNCNIFAQSTQKRTIVDVILVVLQYKYVCFSTMDGFVAPVTVLLLLSLLFHE